MLHNLFHSMDDCFHTFCEKSVKINWIIDFETEYYVSQWANSHHIATSDNYTSQTSHPTNTQRWFFLTFPSYLSFNNLRIYNIIDLHIEARVLGLFGIEIPSFFLKDRCYENRWFDVRKETLRESMDYWRATHPEILIRSGKSLVSCNLLKKCRIIFTDTYMCSIIRRGFPTYQGYWQ